MSRSQSNECGRRTLRYVEHSKYNGRTLIHTQGIRLFTEDRFENPHERLRELILEVVPGVNRNVVLEHVNWVFRLFIGSCTCGDE